MNNEKRVTQIFLVEDHPVIAEALHLVLDNQEGFQVCGLAATGKEALDQVAGHAPDLVLIDVSLSDMSGIEVARRLREEHPDLLLAMLSGHGERSYVEKAIEVGVNGYILKGNTEKMIAGIRQIVGGEPFLSHAVRG